jgi:hypothetical protein
LKYPIQGEFVNESIPTEQLQLVFGMTLQDLVGHLISHCHRARDRKLPETNGASEGFSLLYEPV